MMHYLLQFRLFDIIRFYLLEFKLKSQFSSSFQEVKINPVLKQSECRILKFGLREYCEDDM